MNWEQIISTYGIAGTILLALGIFFWKKGWPFCVEQVERLWKVIDEANRVAKQQSDQFIERLKERDRNQAIMAEEMKKITKHIASIEGKIDNKNNGTSKND